MQRQDFIKNAGTSICCPECRGCLRAGGGHVHLNSTWGRLCCQGRKGCAQAAALHQRPGLGLQCLGAGCSNINCFEFLPSLARGYGHTTPNPDPAVCSRLHQHLLGCCAAGRLAPEVQEGLYDAQAVCSKGIAGAYP